MCVKVRGDLETRTNGTSAMLYTTTPWCSGTSSVILPRCALTTWLPYRNGSSPAGLIHTCALATRIKCCHIRIVNSRSVVQEDSTLTSPSEDTRTCWRPIEDGNSACSRPRLVAVPLAPYPAPSFSARRRWQPQTSPALAIYHWIARPNIKARLTLYLAYFASQSRHVIPSLNLPVLLNLPKHVPSETRFGRATEVASASMARGR